MPISLENLDTRESIPGLVIGTIPGQAGDIYSFPLFRCNFTRWKCIKTWPTTYF